MFGVNAEDLQSAEIQAVHAGFGAEFPSLADPLGAIGEVYRIEHLPTLVIIDQMGNIRHWSSGIPDENGLNVLLDALTEAGNTLDPSGTN